MDQSNRECPRCGKQRLKAETKNADYCRCTLLVDRSISVSTPNGDVTATSLPRKRPLTIDDRVFPKPSPAPAPREFWTAETRLESCDCLSTKPWHFAYKQIHLIEKSAFDAVVREKEILIKEAQDFDVIGRNEAYAEVERLRKTVARLEGEREQLLAEQVQVKLNSGKVGRLEKELALQIERNQTLVKSDVESLHQIEKLQAELAEAANLISMAEQRGYLSGKAYFEKQLTAARSELEQIETLKSELAGKSADNIAAYAKIDTLFGEIEKALARCKRLEEDLTKIEEITRRPQASGTRKVVNEIASLALKKT